MKRTLRVGLWAGMYWFAGMFGLVRYFQPNEWDIVAGDAGLWAVICIGIELMRREAIEGGAIE